MEVEAQVNIRKETQEENNQGGKCGTTGKVRHQAWECGAPKKDPRTCSRCGKRGHVAKVCRAALPIKEVEEEKEEATNWACAMIREHRH